MCFTLKSDPKVIHQVHSMHCTSEESINRAQQAVRQKQATSGTGQHQTSPRPQATAAVANVYTPLQTRNQRKKSNSAPGAKNKKSQTAVSPTARSTSSPAVGPSDRQADSPANSSAGSTSDRPADGQADRPADGTDRQWRSRSSSSPPDDMCRLPNLNDDKKSQFGTDFLSYEI